MVVCSLFLALLAGVACAGQEGRTAYVPVPVSEAAYVTSRFLEASGYVVEQTSRGNNEICLSSQKDGAETEKRSVVLTPHSPLQTKMEMVVDGDLFPEEDFARLVDRLSNKGEAVVRPLPVEPQVIPAPVLDQIGNVVCVHVQTVGQPVQFTGFFIDTEGLLLSTAHDLREHEQVQILTNSGMYYQGNIVKVDFDRDLALIKVDAQREKIISPVDGKNLLSMGEAVFSIGCPRDLGGTIEAGFVNGPPRKIKAVPLWQVHMQIHPGGSGSPVFDSSGAFVAVVKGRHREVEDIGFLIPLEVVVDFLKDSFLL